MSKKIFNAVLQLRRDNDYNYKKIADTFVPANGEVCLVDTARNGLQVVVGDGSSSFGELEFAFSLIVKGYFKDGLFYSDNSFENEIAGSEMKLYIDQSTYSIYVFNGEEFVVVESSELPKASSNKAGVMKLYSTLGDNEDGTMTQKAITDELNEKVEIALNIEEELIIFTND